MFAARREASKVLQWVVSNAQTTSSCTVVASTRNSTTGRNNSKSLHVLSSWIPKRNFSSSSNNDANGSDPYGVNFDDGVNNLGSSDSIVNDDMTNEEREYLQMSKDDLLDDFVDQFVKTWTPEKRKRLVERVQSRQAEKARIGLDQMPEDEEWGRIKAKFKEIKGIDDEGKRDRIDQKYGSFKFESNSLDEDMLNWMKNAPIGNYPQEEDPLPNFKTMGRRKLNRREAVPLPKEMLHHNNLSLLRQYITPGGQIKNRMQTRLGAKDQRKIAKLIKRARAMGLIPHVGNFKVRNNGDIHASDIDEPKDWEITLEEIFAKADAPPKSTSSGTN